MTGTMLENETIGAVLVCGAGVAGIQASLDLADGGFKVYLLDPSPAIGGRMAQLDRTFPTGDCAMCILSPKLVECARNRNIEIITLADVQSVSGQPGKFKVRIRQNPRYIDLKTCDACGDCAEVCPVELPSEFDRGMGARKAVFRPHPQAIPNVFSISKAAGIAPCRATCPAGVNVQGFIALTAAGKIGEAYDLLRQRCPLPASCGRVCGHPCEARCNRTEIDEALSTCDLERFVADYVLANPDQCPPRTPSVAALESRIAVIGGGPAGLTAAADLVLKGYGVTLFEARPQLGGMLRYGIPAFRLPKDVLDKEIQNIIGLGVDVRTNTPIAKPKDLLKTKAQPSGNVAPAHEFGAVFIATGAWIGKKMDIPGEDAPEVREGAKFLCEINSGNNPEVGPNVVVIGSTDVAVDAARCALRLPGVESVSLVCIETREEMPAHSWAVTEAVKEGMVLREGLGPTRVETLNGKTVSVAFRACTSAFDEFKHFDPLFDDSKISSIPADTVIVAVGQQADSSRLGVELRPGGRIRADSETLATSVEGIFAGGDAVLGPASVVDAMAQGHRAAEAIDAHLRGTAHIRNTGTEATLHAVSANPVVRKYATNPKPDALRQERARISSGKSAGQLLTFNEVNPGLNREQAVSEAKRCLSCGLCSECMQCVKACEAGAVLHDQVATESDIEVGSIILAPGIEEFQASLWSEFGHGRYPNVLSSVQFERMLSAAGPTGGSVQRPSDGGVVKKIAFIQCVGSRNAARGNGHCSSICCMSATKEAIAVKEQARDGKLDISILGTEIRAFGKDFDSYIGTARDEYGVKYILATPFSVTEAQDTRSLRVHSVDQRGLELQEEFDLVVLSTGLQAPTGAKDLAGRLGLNLNDFGFARTNRFLPTETSRPGIYVAGAFQEPKDISDSVAQASAAAACAMGQLTAVRGTMIQRHEYPWERDITDEPPRIGVFVCHCGHNIASVVDVDQVTGKAAVMPDVKHAEANMYTCSDATQQHIKEMIAKHRLNRLVVASCWSRTHETLFQETLRESGLNPYLFAMTNIRDQCSWVHKDDPAAATAKAMDLVSMAVARARHLKALRNGEVPVTPSALILGGGLGGMTAALGIADQGYKVHLVEKSPFLGGLLRNLHLTPDGEDIQQHLTQLKARIESHPQIVVYTNSCLTRISGQVGNFQSMLDVAGHEQPVEHGVVIVATGGRERSTEKFLHGSNPHVITQSKLEAALAGGSLPSGLKDKLDPTVVMIQCVESRDKRNPYCSRVCCSEAIKNALAIKRLQPQSDVIILARDIRTYGFREAYLQKARQLGVRFVRFAEGNEPSVVEEAGRPKVSLHDESTAAILTLHSDLLVLSTGIGPAEDNQSLSGMLRSSLTSDGFFLEAHPKLRPVDLANEGEFLCGLAHSPRFIDETVAQAQAAAGRAARILSRAELEILGQVAHVNPAYCVACATCVKVCPYGAPMINSVRKSEIQGAKCLGCGSCAAVCPAKTISLLHQEGETTVAMLDELLVGGGRS
jgi:heterodisulfide reductase subunit A-like polyferredoxin